jgi:lauroyl/myristoyl acyltransferase
MPNFYRETLHPDGALAPGLGRIGFVTFRHFLSWKPLFYDTFLPILRRLGPVRGDAVLEGLGRSLATVWPPRRAELAEALQRVRDQLDAPWDLEEIRTALEGNAIRFLARDCMLEGADDADFFARFDVSGFEHVQEARDRGRGVIVVGCHLGSHLSGMHWLYRRGVPLRLLIQRPQHVSHDLQRWFDDRDGPHAQSGFFLRRDLTPEVGSQRVFRTRAALRDGMVVYVKGDVPWVGSNTRPGRLLGFERTFQSLWAELAALFRAPVVPMFCRHRPGGRFALNFDPAWTVARGEEGSAVARYLERLESEILAHPADAVAHLLWPCYGPPSRREYASPRPAPRPSASATPVV